MRVLNATKRAEVLLGRCLGLMSAHTAGWIHVSAGTAATARSWGNTFVMLAV